MKNAKNEKNYVFTLVSEDGLEIISRGDRRRVEKHVRPGKSVMITLKKLSAHVDTIINILQAFISAGKKELGLKYLDEAIKLGHWTIVETRTGNDLADAVVVENINAMYGQRLN
jgi:hypothetical protein